MKVWFDDQSFMTCDALIVAEGIHSTIRKTVIAFRSTIRYSGYTCWRGLTTDTNLNIQETSETWGKNGAGIVPVETIRSIGLLAKMHRLKIKR
ncbi:MAG: hypothetical protein IPG07_15710 [Crocinitomicaceae bacterium]|nr:hypothetical protein [Crocinitomicaceae bacterium]